MKLGQRSPDFVEVLMLVNCKVTDDHTLWPFKTPRAVRGRYRLGSACTCGAKLRFRFHWLFSWTCVLVPEHKDQFSMNPSLLTDLFILTLQGDMSLISDWRRTATSVWKNRTISINLVLKECILACVHISHGSQRFLQGSTMAELSGVRLSLKCTLVSAWGNFWIHQEVK